MPGSANQNESEIEPLPDEPLLDELRQVRRVTLERQEDPSLVPETGYEIRRELRRGGQGIVYEAIQRSTGRRVALKVLLHGGFRSEREKQRFCREVDLLAGLRHRSIVTLFDSGELNGEPFYAMEFIDGHTLNATPELCFPGKQTGYPRLRAHVRKVLRTVAVVCEAVACFQRNGLVHRDLKPDNILVDRDGLPHIVDFGLARISALDTERPEPFDYRHGFTLTGEFLGTPAYASPEQATGDSRDVDIRSDVYSLGVILFELLTGQLPVPMTGSIVEILRRIAEQNPVRPSAITGSIDSDVDAIVLKCLSKDPERRYQSAAELAADLRRWLDGQPVTARSDSAWYVIRRSLRKHKLAAGTAIGFVTLISAAGIVSLLLWRQAVRDRNEARAEVYVASLYAANAAQNEHRTLDAMDLLMRPAKELRGWEWQYVLSRIDHAASTSKLFAENVKSCAWSTDRQLLALIDTTGRLRLHKTADGSPASLANELSESRPTIVAFRPGDSELLIAEQAGRIRLFDMHQSKWSEIHGLPTGEPLAVSFDRTGQLLTAQHGHLHWILGVSFSGADEVTSVSGHGELKRFRIGFDTNDRRLDLHTSVVTAIRFIQSGEALLTASLDGRMQAVRADSGQLIANLISGSVAVTATGADENRSLIAVGSADGAVSILSAETGKELRFVSGPAIQESSPARAIAVSTYDGLLAVGLENGEIRLRHMEGRNQESILKQHKRPVRFVGFVNAGALLVSEDETSLIVTDVRTRRVRHQLTPPLSAYYAPVAIQPATGLIAAGDSMGRINVWNAETGHRQAPFQWHARICFPEHAGDVRPAVSAVSGFRGFSAADSGICPERTGGPFHEYLRGRADEDTDWSYCVAGDQSPQVRSGTPAASPKTRRPVGDFHRIARMSFAADH